ncbi:hypothetical protein PT974_07352 [Cladobotryum mycophilum]|uniref:Uncharacterized protein n=1 Tax=Cladobotryum mycophilum TaxID=491253 RepID=A0ABR0SP79_9HYPO
MCRVIICPRNYVCGHVWEQSDWMVDYPTDCGSCGEVRERTYVNPSNDTKPCGDCIRDRLWTEDGSGGWIKSHTRDILKYRLLKALGR